LALIEIRKTIDLPGGAVELYEYLLTPSNIAEYVGPIRNIRPAHKKVQVGTRLSVEVNFLGIHFSQGAECTVLHPPERFACRSVGGRFNFEAGFTLHPTALGTRLDGWGNASAPSLFRFAQPALRFLIERQVDRDLARLKEVYEAGNDSPANGPAGR
jgi:hypothetical protein